MALEFVHHSDHYTPVASAKNFSQIPEVSGCSPLRVLRSLARVRAQRRKREGAVALRAFIADRNLLSALRKGESKGNSAQLSTKLGTRQDTHVRPRASLGHVATEVSRHQLINVL